jgi:hypothetical protein
VIPLAHIAGLPVEETIRSLVPVLVVGFGAFTATLRGRRRRSE